MKIFQQEDCTYRKCTELNINKHLIYIFNLAIMWGDQGDAIPNITARDIADAYRNKNSERLDVMYPWYNDRRSLRGIIFDVIDIAVRVYGNEVEEEMFVGVTNRETRVFDEEELV